MTAANSAAARDTDQAVDRTKPRSTTSTAMALQTQRAYDATPQMFVRLTGSHHAKPRAATVTHRAKASA
ncbi:hypothetical protein C2U70_15045 [Bradyrhizobium guangdongense]|uniref:hypothetical protein n=1 Tax=Bradyrhizobium guangdongense TaxID=1325090 RepID=UPI00112BF299|nr:hypothetical protein [Bradyrhizobium guangdongense]TPQ35231.1 hypothetical protein C2U70_15045 [Bradyrhizobium guangdongense]